MFGRVRQVAAPVGGRVVRTGAKCAPWCVTVNMPTGQTNRRMDVTLRFKLDAASVKTYQISGCEISR